MNQRLRRGGVLVLVPLTTCLVYLLKQPTTTPTVQAAEKAILSFPDQPSDRQPEQYQGSFLFSSTRGMLEALKVTIYPEDKVYAFPDPSLGLGSRLLVYHAQPVLIKDGGDERLVRTWKKKVSELLAEQHLDLADKDQVVPAFDTLLPSGLPTVTITRVAISELKVNRVIDFDIQQKDDPTAERGSSQISQVGQTGTMQKTYLVRRENGQEVSRSLIKQEVIKPPVNQVVLRGTKVVEYGSGSASWYEGVGSYTAAHPNLPLGTRVRVVNLSNGKSVTVTIADRGPFVGGRIIDLSADAFAQIAPIGAGIADVRLEKSY